MSGADNTNETITRDDSLYNEDVKNSENNSKIPVGVCISGDKIVDINEIQVNDNNATKINAESNQKKEIEYIGLANQGATCYLNSLLQTLFMTPEIRKKLFKWSYNPQLHGAAERSIPLQLQTLFGNLCLSNGKPSKTKKLTASFGWTLSDAFSQHDVQELMRVLFDALDKSLSPTEFSRRRKEKEETKKDIIPSILDQTPDQIQDSSDFFDQESVLVSDFFSGLLIDYIYAIGQKKPDGSPYGREREDIFMDVQLNAKVGSVAESLNEYVKPEILDKDNQWFCEDLERKVDAEKGLKFKKLPYFLTLHLKRFDFDYESMKRIKLSHKVEFPFELDMTRFVEKDEASIPLEKRQRYELYSVLVHSGSALWGHYYAYIKSFETQEWYQFNDKNVKPASVAEVEQMFGGDGNEYGSSTSAYMLIYRLIDPKRNIKKVENSMIPQEIVDKIAEKNKKSEQKLILQKERDDRIYLKCNLDDQPELIEVITSRKKLVKDVKEDILKTMIESKIWPENFTVDRFRIRDSSLSSRQVGKIFEEDVPMGEFCYATYSLRTVVIEIKNDAGEWPVHVRTIELSVDYLRPDSQMSDHKHITVRADLKLWELKQLFLDEIYMKKNNNNNKSPEPESKSEQVSKEVATTEATQPELTWRLIAIAKSKFELCEYYTAEMNEKTIEELGISYTTWLYVELLSSEGAEPKIPQILDEQYNSYDIYYTFGEFQGTLTMHKEKTIKDLKQAIKNEFKLDHDNFRLLTGYTKLPLKGEDRKLKDAMYDRFQTCIEFGPSVEPDEFLIPCYLFDHTFMKGRISKSAKEILAKRKAEETSAPPTADQESQETIELPKTPTENTISAPKRLVEDYWDQTEEQDDDDSPERFKFPPQKYYDKLKRFKPIKKVIIKQETLLQDVVKDVAAALGVDENLLRVRVKLDQDLGGALCERNETIQKNLGKESLTDHTQFAFQILPKPEVIQNDTVFMLAQQYHPSQFKFEKYKEISVSRAAVKTSDELKSAIVEQLELKTESGANLDIDLAVPPELAIEGPEIDLLDWNFSTKNVFWRPLVLDNGSLMLFKDHNEKSIIPPDFTVDNNSTTDKFIPTIYFKESDNGSSVKESRFVDNKSRRTEQALKISTFYDDVLEKQSTPKEEEAKKE